MNIHFQTLSLYGPMKVQKVTGAGRPYYVAALHGHVPLCFKSRAEAESFAALAHSLALTFAQWADRPTVRYFQNRE